jgi:hypothetical protein
MTAVAGISEMCKADGDKEDGRRGERRRGGKPFWQVAAWVSPDARLVQRDYLFLPATSRGLVGMGLWEKGGLMMTPSPPSLLLPTKP